MTDEHMRPKIEDLVYDASWDTYFKIMGEEDGNFILVGHRQRMINRISSEALHIAIREYGWYIYRRYEVK